MLGATGGGAGAGFGAAAVGFGAGLGAGLGVDRTAGAAACADAAGCDVLDRTTGGVFWTEVRAACEVRWRVTACLFGAPLAALVAAGCATSVGDDAAALGEATAALWLIARPMDTASVPAPLRTVMARLAPDARSAPRRRISRGAQSSVMVPNVRKSPSSARCFGQSHTSESALKPPSLSRFRGWPEVLHMPGRHGGHCLRTTISHHVQEPIVRHPDRHTARDRIGVATTGLAVGGTLGVVAVAGGLAVHARSAASPVTVSVHTSAPRTTAPTPSRPHAQPTRRTVTRTVTRRSGSVSAGGGQPQAQSSGS
ncbi:MAG: hypothetical protein JWQ32_3252 [Marmoricola sp.]|nr:hypothetical protein [Marmoricola sp.]